MSANIHAVRPIKLPIGVSDFRELICGGYTFVDKTLMIKEVLDQGAKVTLITRPRRFGKTLNLGMLQYFFAAQVDGHATAGLFDPLAIARHPDAMAEQGRHPVVFFTFKDMESEHFEEFEARMRRKLSGLCKQHLYLLDSPRLLANDRRIIDALLNETASREEMSDALRFLCELLHSHHDKRAIVLLDEYDAPIHAAQARGFYGQLTSFMRILLGSALKDNRYLYKAVLTGILRISKESLFSGLNNIQTQSVLDEGYAGSFGFTGPEVSALLSITGLGDNADKIKDWYNGYRFGNEIIHNPWSIVSCLDAKGKLAPYWINSGDSSLLKRLMAQADADFKEELERLLVGVPVNEFIDPNLAFSDLSGNTTAVWSLLLYSGYLTALAIEHTQETRTLCRLAIPNREIAGLYQRYIKEWFSDTMGVRGYEQRGENLHGSHSISPFPPPFPAEHTARSDASHHGTAAR